MFMMQIKIRIEMPVCVLCECDSTMWLFFNETHQTNLINNITSSKFEIKSRLL